MVRSAARATSPTSSSSGTASSTVRTADLDGCRAEDGHRPRNLSSGTTSASVYGPTHGRLPSRGADDRHQREPAAANLDPASPRGRFGFMCRHGRRQQAVGPRRIQPRPRPAIDTVAARSMPCRSMDPVVGNPRQRSPPGCLTSRKYAYRGSRTSSGANRRAVASNRTTRRQARTDRCVGGHRGEIPQMPNACRAPSATIPCIARLRTPSRRRGARDTNAKATNASAQLGDIGARRPSRDRPIRSSAARPVDSIRRPEVQRPAAVAAVDAHRGCGGNIHPKYPGQRPELTAFAPRQPPSTIVCNSRSNSIARANDR